MNYINIIEEFDVDNENRVTCKLCHINIKTNLKEVIFPLKKHIPIYKHQKRQTADDLRLIFKMNNKEYQTMFIELTIGIHLIQNSTIYDY